MPDIAFFATETPEPGQHYAAFTMPGLTIFVRAAETESLDTAEDLRLPHETLLNTYEADFDMAVTKEANTIWEEH